MKKLYTVKLDVRVNSFCLIDTAWGVGRDGLWEQKVRRGGVKFDIMTTSFFLGKRTLKPSPTSGMPTWQDNLFVALSKQAANATDFFSIPSDRVVELGAQVTI